MTESRQTPNYSSPAGEMPPLGRISPLSKSRTELPAIILRSESGQAVVPSFMRAMGPAAEGEAPEPLLSEWGDVHATETVLPISNDYNASLNGLISSKKGDMEEDRSVTPGSRTMSGMSPVDGASPEPNEITRGKGVSQRKVGGKDSEPPKYTTHTVHIPPHYPLGSRQAQPVRDQVPTRWETWRPDLTCRSRDHDKGRMKKSGRTERELTTALHQAGLPDTLPWDQIGKLASNKGPPDRSDPKVPGYNPGGEVDPPSTRGGQEIFPFTAIPSSQPETKPSTNAEFESRPPGWGSTTGQDLEPFALVRSKESPSLDSPRIPRGGNVRETKKELKQHLLPHIIA